MARTSVIYCTVCNSKAVIEKTERVHSEFSRFYCACRNPQCGHRFVMNLEFGHTTRSSLLTKESLLKLTLNQLSADDKANLMKILNEKNKNR